MAHDTIDAVVRRYGINAPKVIALARVRPDLGDPLHPGLPFAKAEVMYAAANEMTVNLEDLLRRRLPMLVLNPPDEHLIEMAADLAAAQLGWDAPRREEEVASILEKWRPEGN